MSLQPDQMIAHYRLLEQIGEGGMGVVWKALDTNLDREVAIKVLPEHFAGDSERLARFEREAKLLASLNHTHIASIFGLHEADGQRFLAMELIPGESLDVHLERGTMPMDEALRLALDVAEALEAAHENGVIHRDLKPANIQVGPDGHVKVLDFGLAKAFATESPGATGETSLSPTVTSAGTMVGTILGTAAYMSPEQARGRAVDKRTDIWSFGVVLFECLAGKRLFKGESVPDSMGAILHKDPDWTALPAETPERIRELLLRCLDKDARKRLRDIGDARLELEAALGMEPTTMSGRPVTTGTAATASRGRLLPLAAVVVAAVAGAVAGAAVWSVMSGGPTPAPAADRQVVRLSLAVPDDRTAEEVWLSPDGNTIVYRGVSKETESEEVDRLYIRRLDEYEATPVAGSDRGDDLRFSPDSKWMFFLAPASARSSQRRMVKAPVDGSTPPQALADWDRNWQNAVWISNDEIAVITRPPQSIIRIPATGGTPGPPLEVTPQGFEGDVSLDHALPDGQHVLGSSSLFSDRGWTRRVSVVDLQSGEAHILVEDGSSPRWSPTGHLLFSRQDTILAATFDPSVSLDVGGPVAISSGLRTFNEWNGGYFQISASGSLAYFPGGVIGGNRQLAYLEDGELQPWAGERRTYINFLEVSPDGKRFSVTIGNPKGLFEVWISEIGRPRLRRFAAVPGRDCMFAVWSHDSTQIAYLVTDQGSEGGVYVRKVDGSEPPRLILSYEGLTGGIHPTSFSGDGRKLLIDHHGSEENRILIRDLDEPEGEAEMLVAGAFMGKVSWDGRWLAYTSRTSGRDEVYIRNLEPDLTTGAEIPVTTTEATGGDWLKQEGALRLSYDSQREHNIVTINTESGITISAPKTMANTRELQDRIIDGDWLPDGRAFVLVRGEDEEPVDEIRIVLNWVEQLKARTGSF